MLAFLKSSGPGPQGMVLLTQGWALLHQLTRQCPASMTTGQLDLIFPSRKTPFSGDSSLRHAEN